MNRYLRIVVLIIALGLSLWGCKKEEKPNPCELVVQDDFELVP